MTITRHKIPQPHPNSNVKAAQHVLSTQAALVPTISATSSTTAIGTPRSQKKDLPVDNDSQPRALQPSIRKEDTVAACAKYVVALQNIRDV